MSSHLHATFTQVFVQQPRVNKQYLQTETGASVYKPVYLEDQSYYSLDRNLRDSVCSRGLPGTLKLLLIPGAKRSPVCSYLLCHLASLHSEPSCITLLIFQATQAKTMCIIRYRIFLKCYCFCSLTLPLIASHEVLS